MPSRRDTLQVSARNLVSIHQEKARILSVRAATYTTNLRWGAPNRRLVRVFYAHVHRGRIEMCNRNDAITNNAGPIVMERRGVPVDSLG